MSFNQPVCNFSQNTVKVSKIKWTQQEDELLTSVVSKFGASRWDFIATHIPGRNGRQCRERYISVLTPSVCKDAWTAAEDETLLRLQKQIGNHWSLISKSLPGRTAIMAKNRYRLLCRHETMYGRNSKQVIFQNSIKPKNEVIENTILSPPSIISSPLNQQPQTPTKLHSHGHEMTIPPLILQSQSRNFPALGIKSLIDEESLFHYTDLDVSVF
ncbi:Myb-like DNA-binding domain containing protein [Trichomonas vaginalis G3]|uniref:Myb-like DNA-binding domain containing protein n=1 Tax=Trichomonas vaginalis (strain ATCC PRA-98 / G3) TaxID=412133 RepID=A2F739_TRIV3|nr:RNA polymerase II transcription regulator recruiting protein [Trichomonas vaginalis G3]EAX99276.1 Myb-like DNA-binding domain containing protein [Trichomonas vaginalis G3]KAI5524942.1 RNA polymerase II transcription regulator recruiting protein [Trichomonas vaginalis G3]|eukprot:XP_001312206.1 Myb-like DNA-binding domain containing protein [Trichomonas vaginalis G3]